MPTWLISAGTKAMAFLKQYWALVLVAALLAVAYSAWRQEQANVAGTIDKLNKAHAAEIDQINQARAQEATQKQAELQALQDSLAKIQQDYAAKQQQVIVEQHTEAADIVKKYGDDPTALAQQLAQSFDFAVLPGATK
jgi:TolA-binding protein